MEIFGIRQRTGNQAVSGLSALIILIGLTMLCSCAHIGSPSDSRTDNDDTERLSTQGMITLALASYREAVEYGDSLMAIASENPSDTKAAIYGRIIIGQACIFIPERATECYPALSEAEQLAIQAGDNEALVSVYNGLGLYTLNRGMDPAGALFYLFKGLDIAKKYGFSNLHALLLTNIAVSYYLRNDPVGLHYAQECYYYGKDNHNSMCVFIGALTSASFHKINNDSDLALRFIREAETLLHRLKLYNVTGDLYCTYADILYSRGDEAGAEELYIKALEESANMPESEIEIHLGYAQLLAGQENPRKAIVHLDSALAISSASGYGIRRTDILNLLSKSYSRLGNTAKALHYSTLYNQEKDSISRAEKETNLEESRIRYDYERAENALMRQKIDLLQKDRALNWLISLILIVVCVTVTLVILYRRKSRLYSAIVKQTADAVRNEKLLRETIRDLERRMASGPASTTPREEESHDTDSSQPSSTITPEKQDEIISRLESLMLDVSVYTDNDITKDKVARLIGTNRTYLSRIINDHYGMTFTQFINSLRIKEAIRILSDTDDDTPLKAISHQLGFNSMSTFYSRFAAETGMTPATYRTEARQLLDKQPEYPHEEED
ncbi:helix-turn-helix domain-containing protein [uncultured Duncaniella sp.]|uniref:helix-turn-helix domain-containing protein n=1 Tax=uncultured Duncaniella sp. TaxID=2768039 RepID=UPI0026753BDF|nr:helix-turn-helix domain-containing protein [uncultured Duncaniella sp.]MCI9172718.1 helix-turn-helix domain-containing protein [Muribaculaceae bacterium]